MKNDMEFEIPIDDAINEFGYHLLAHPRTIFSAKFGDGKTYFLSKFIEEQKNSFEFITLHPINYQVVDNKDIFELIKRDILFQITLNNMLDENLEIDNMTGLLFYIQNNYKTVTESFISYINLLHSSPVVTKAVLAALQTNKLIKTLKDKISEIKKDYKTTDALEEFYNKVDSKCILEEDIVTRIIQDSIDKYKKDYPEKKMVLLIEDMDRLDPAHLFRIMNVFSAHLDTNEKYFIQNSQDKFYNKFHFDNIVFVEDYDNTKNIFEHFYGKNTNFEGYIQKFITKGYYKYSLLEQRHKYILKRIVELTELPKEYVDAVISAELLNEKNLRVIVDSFNDIDSQIKEKPVFNNQIIHKGLLKLYIIIKRLQLDESIIIQAYRKMPEELSLYVFKYFVGYLAILYANNRYEFYCTGLNGTVPTIIDIGLYNSETGLFDHIRTRPYEDLVYNNRYRNQSYNSFDNFLGVMRRFASE